ncbi:hypothetical protein [Amycolatopsis thermoflava]|uniref:hypothetical protein n=1 Tax=Amycolatopsis thermoflava TaxID=84480 RepID=UPI00365A543A
MPHRLALFLALLVFATLLADPIGPAPSATASEPRSAMWIDQSGTAPARPLDPVGAGIAWLGCGR